LQKGAQSIETERFRESHGLRKGKRVRKRLKTKIVGEAAPRKRKVVARLPLFQRMFT
jgi:hypothetical protein